MRTRTRIVLSIGLIVALALVYSVGYKQGEYHWPSDGRQRPRGITLATVLRQRGVTPESIAYFRFIGDEPSFTSGRVATNTSDVTWIWDRMIETAEPYVFWESSGWRRVEIYTRDSPQPAVTLAVNATDATCISGDDRTFMCHGLHELVLHLLSPPQTAKIE
ncbi:MAG: hypothetical protein EPO07_01675 [Verrucomicrobia bacterium]|nr:MAG: hypothetical protein EPO07_01675 [Verrucomicrobiota bacterium]